MNFTPDYENETEIQTNNQIEIKDNNIIINENYSSEKFIYRKHCNYFNLCPTICNNRLHLIHSVNKINHLVSLLMTFLSVSLVNTSLSHLVAIIFHSPSAMDSHALICPHPTLLNCKHIHMLYSPPTHLGIPKSTITNITFMTCSNHPQITLYLIQPIIPTPLMLSVK